MQKSIEAITTAWGNFIDLLLRFIPQVLALLLIVLVGWLCAKVASFLARRTLRLIRFDALLERSGTTELLQRASAPPPARIVGTAVFWIVWIAFLFAGMHALGLTGADLLAADVVRLLPRLVIALLLVVVGIALSNFLWRAALLAAVNANLPSPRLIGGFVRVVALFATGAAALEQLDVARSILQSVFMIAFGAVMLAGAIAFGLGGRHLARRLLEEKLGSRRDRPSGSDEEPPHV